jgi:uncharacterized membrane protein (DUF4010 family)
MYPLSLETSDLIQRLGLALAIGLIMGIERGWQERAEAEGGRTAGIRTFALIGLLGGVWAALLGNAGPEALGLVFLGLSLVIALFRFREGLETDNFGATTVIAAMLAFSLGAYAVVGDQIAAAAAGVAATAVLAVKTRSHAWLKRMTWLELRAFLILLSMTLILLPVLPNRGFGPQAAINPRQLWLLTVLIAAVSFVGYVIVKVAGPRHGAVLYGLAGGMTSSTAVTINMAHLARQHPEHTSLFAASSLLAGVAMAARMLLLVATLRPELIITLAPSLGPAAGVMALAAFFLLRRAAEPGRQNELVLKNPLDLRSVLTFGAVLAGILALAKTLATAVGEYGVLVLAVVSGTVDVDAITLSMAQMAGHGVPSEVAALAILVVAATNTVSKTVIAWAGGGRRMGLILSAVVAMSFCVGALGYLFVPHAGIAP